MRTFTVHVINVKILLYPRIVEKPLYTQNFLVDRLVTLIVDRCVTNVEYVRIVHRSRLLNCIKSCCYIVRYRPLDLFELAERD